MRDKSIIFTTERCAVRRFEARDIPDFSVYRNNMEWMRYQGMKGLSETAYRDILLHETDFEKGVQLAIVDFSNQLIGDLYVHEKPDVREIGVTISPARARRGYAKEAVSGLIDYLRRISAKPIIAEAEAENIPSVRLFEKLGFREISEEDGIKRFFREI